MFVDNFSDFWIFVAFAVDDVAPVAPYRTDIEQNGFVFRFGLVEYVLAPLIPIDGLVCSGTKIRAGGIFETILRMRGHEKSFFKLKANALAGGNLARAITGRYYRAPGREDRSACVRQTLRPGGGRNECDLRQVSSKDTLPDCRSPRENRAGQRRGL